MDSPVLFKSYIGPFNVQVVQKNLQGIQHVQTHMVKETDETHGCKNKMSQKQKNTRWGQQNKFNMRRKQQLHAEANAESTSGPHD